MGQAQVEPETTGVIPAKKPGPAAPLRPAGVPITGKEAAKAAGTGEGKTEEMTTLQNQNLILKNWYEYVKKLESAQGEGSIEEVRQQLKKFQAAS